MKTFLRSMALLALTALLTVSLCAPALAEETAFVDYAGQLGFRTQSETVKQQVTVKSFVDGDTTHFYAPETIAEDGVLKARYLACNTPESTGKIEEWGKAASRFTREKLESAEEIWVESDNENWNLDSTSTRFLVWVWYRPQGEHTFRNLNIELLQEGLAIANSSAQNRYGDTCMAAIAQARDKKLHIYSGEKDPDFFYGDAIELTIKELRLHPEEYNGKKVAFNGVITMDHSNSVFIEDYDEETGLYFGISAYYGFNMSGAGLDILTVGNEVRIVGTMQYYEAGHAWQVAGMTYRMMKPKDPGNIQKLSEGNKPRWKEISAEDLQSTVILETESGAQNQYAFPYLAQCTSVSMAGLKVTQADLSENGDLLFLLGECDTGDAVSLIIPGHLSAANELMNKTIDIRGILQGSENAWYIRVYTQDGLTIRDEQ
ncbi:MAG: thermonuclease family protein [Clostridia bacterium]|nr:thermonuclease family protein [Clostridia bacterium]